MLIGFAENRISAGKAVELDRAEACADRVFGSEDFACTVCFVEMFSQCGGIEGGGAEQIDVGFIRSI